ncbi:MAG: hypothetical protein C0434_13690, partial [Xanthomonadaceae bacterium]|nr:hypothetical protein [Xanthomonadaceae bacterium]
MTLPIRRIAVLLGGALLGAAPAAFAQPGGEAPAARAQPSWNDGGNSGVPAAAQDSRPAGIDWNRPAGLQRAPSALAPAA